MYVDKKRLLLLIVAAGIIWKLLSGPARISEDLPYQLAYVVQEVAADPEDHLPMVIALHGSGAHERDLFGVFENFSLPIRVVSFRAPVSYGSGYRWAQSQGRTRKEAESAYNDMLDEVAYSISESVGELTETYPTKGYPFVLRFSEGAILSYYLAVAYPETFTAVFAIAGELSEDLLPDSGSGPYPAIYGYHGKSDRLISIGKGRSAIERIRTLASDVQFTEFPGGHTIPGSVIEDIETNMSKYTN